MKSAQELAERARALADEIKAILVWSPQEGMYGGYWTSRRQDEAAVIAAAASALGFMSRFAGPESEWFTRARIAWESKGDNTSLETGAYAVAEILVRWAADVDRGLALVAGADATTARTVASTDLMEQVRVLVKDRTVHPAAPIVLAGAALETALRGAAQELELGVSGPGSITAYGKALRSADAVTKQEMKDIEQMSGLRNAAAHGDFDHISAAHASLMEQQVNLFLSRLADRLGD